MSKPENGTMLGRSTAGPSDGAASLLLDCYDRHRRLLPWRAVPGEKPDVYRIWLSEIMLQQTKVVTVCSYYQNFILKWPTLTQLAKAKRTDVLRLWAGLGYYARARNLYACAQIVMDKYGGNFPDTEENLRSLPGIGPYTAAAITAIAYNQRAVVVDGNVERIMARLYTVEKPIAKTRPLLRQIATRLTPQDRPGDYAQAIMDLGALICTPRSPKCVECPWTGLCKAHRTGTPECWPRKKTKVKKPQRYGVAFWIERSDGAVMLRRRPDKGILGGMTEIPNSIWYDHPLSERSVRAQSPIKTHWKTIPGLVRHGFTHFNLELTILTAKAEKTPKDAFWCPKRKIKSEPLPSLMRKVAALVQAAQNSS